MTTRATKAVSRVSGTVFDAGRRELVITIYPGGVIGLRPSRLRREETIDAATLYRNAVAARVRAERAAKAKAKGKR